MASTSVVERTSYHINKNDSLNTDVQTVLKVGMTTTNPPIQEGQSSANPAYGVTPLMQACQQGRDTTVRQILHQQQRTAHDRDKTGKTALHYCAENSSLSCIEQLINVDPNLMDARDEDGYTPLHLATIAGNKTVSKYLISKGADIHARDNEMHTAVHWATVCGEIDLLDMLIDSGADPCTPDIHGAYPIHYAAQMCGPNSELGHEVHIGLQVLQKLLKRGVSVSVKDHDGRQPLLWAASAEVRPSHVYCPSGSADAILALVNAGADVAADDKDGLTALHCAASRGHVDCLDVLISLCSAEVDTLDTNGCTPLFYAATLGHADCTELLLKHGAIPDRQDRKGRTPAHCGAAKGQLETLKMLHRRGADLWKRNIKGDLPLHEACQSGRKDLVMWLLSLQPEAVNAPNNDGRCPLHIAAINNNTEMCKILMDYKASVNPIMRNSRGQLMTPVDAAVARGNRGCAKYLQLHGGLPASKLTDKRALQLAMQKALEAGPIEPTGATPSDFMGEFTSSSTPIAKTPSTTALSPTLLSPNAALQMQSSIALQMGPSSFSPPPIDSGSQTDASQYFLEPKNSNSDEIKNIVLREQNLIRKKGKGGHEILIVNGVGKANDKTGETEKKEREETDDNSEDNDDAVGDNDDNGYDDEEASDDEDNGDDEANAGSSKKKTKKYSNKSESEEVSVHTTTKKTIRKSKSINKKEKSSEGEADDKNTFINDSRKKDKISSHDTETTTKKLVKKSRSNSLSKDIISKEDLKKEEDDELKTEINVSKETNEKRGTVKKIENSKEKARSQENKNKKSKTKSTKEGSITETDNSKRAIKNVGISRSRSVGVYEDENKTEETLKRANSDSEIHKIKNKKLNTISIKQKNKNLQDLKETKIKKVKKLSQSDEKENNKKLSRNTTDKKKDAVVNRKFSKEGSKETTSKEEKTQKRELKRNGRFNVNKNRTQPEKSKLSDKNVKGQKSDKETTVGQKNKSDEEGQETNEDEENEEQIETSAEENSESNSAASGDERSKNNIYLAVPEREEGDGASEDGEAVDASDHSSSNKSTKKKMIKKKRITKKRNTKSATSNASKTRELEQLSDADKSGSSSDEFQNDETKTEDKNINKSEKRQSRPRTAVRSASTKDKKYLLKLKKTLSSLEGENVSLNSSDERTHEILLQYSGRETGLVRESPPDNILSPLQADIDSKHTNLKHRALNGNEKNPFKTELSSGEVGVKINERKTKTKYSHPEDQIFNSIKQNTGTRSEGETSNKSIENGKSRAKSLDLLELKQNLQGKKGDERQKRSNEDEINKAESENEVESESDSGDEQGEKVDEVKRKERREMRLKRRKAKLQKRSKVTAGEKGNEQETKKDIKRVLSGGPKKVESIESNMRKKITSPATEVSITRAMQSTMRKYSLERRLFQQLLDMKRLQIRNSRANENVLIKRMIDEYNKERSYLGLRSYTGPYSFSNYEKYLYDQLRMLQSSQGNKIPQFKNNDDIEKLSRALRKANVPDLNQTYDKFDEEDVHNCNHSTHRCHHAIHAYTGVPCAAYLSQYHKNIKAGRIKLPEIPTSPVVTIRESNNRKMSTDRSTGGLRNYDPKKPLKVELQHGNAKQQISLPTNILDKSRKYQLTVSIQPSSKGNKSKVNIRSETQKKTTSVESDSLSSARSAPDPSIRVDTTPSPPKDLHSAPMNMGRTPLISKATKPRPQK